MRCLPLSRLSDGEKWPLQPNTNRTLYSLRSALRNQGSLTSEPGNTMHAKPNRDTVPQVINGRINGKFAPGYSGNPGGSPEATRRAFNKRFLLDLAEDWQQHGREVFKRVRRESPAAYLKVCVVVFCTVVKGGAAARTVIAMQDGGTGTGAQHGGAGGDRRVPLGAGREANLIFVLPPNVYVGPPVGGTFWFQIFIQAPSLEIWRKTILVAEVAGAVSGVACFGLPP